MGGAWIQRLGISCGGWRPLIKRRWSLRRGLAEGHGLRRRGGGADTVASGGRASATPQIPRRQAKGAPEGPREVVITAAASTIRMKILRTEVHSWFCSCRLFLHSSCGCEDTNDLQAPR